MHGKLPLAYVAYIKWHHLKMFRPILKLTKHINLRAYHTISQLFKTSHNRPKLQLTVAFSNMHQKLNLLKICKIEI